MSTKKESLEFNGTFQMINKKHLRIDQVYQRELADKRSIQQWVKDFSVDKWPTIGALPVSKRKDGLYWAMDGQRRGFLLTQVPGVTMIPCIVFEHLTIQQEAEHFGSINNGRVSVNAVDKFKARLVAKDAEAVALNKIITNSGWEVDKTGGALVVKCIAAVEYSYRAYGGHVVKRVLDFCAEYHEGLLHQTLFKALALLDHTLIHARDEGIEAYSHKLGSYAVCLRAIADMKAEHSVLGTGDNKLINVMALHKLLNKGKKKKIKLDFKVQRSQLSQLNQ